MHKRFSSFCLAALITCTGCAHYSFQNSSSKQIALSIPYVDGDDTGNLTNVLISSISSRSHFRVESDARYQLQVEILNSKEEKLAYRPNPSNHHKIIPCENRSEMLAKVSLVDKTSEKVIRGPGFVRASIDYDHQDTAKDDTINKFSLGQLGDINTYEDSRPIPVFRDLSDKIALWVEQQHALLPFDQ